MGKGYAKEIRSFAFVLRFSLASSTLQLYGHVMSPLNHDAYPGGGKSMARSASHFSSIKLQTDRKCTFHMEIFQCHLVSQKPRF